MGASVTLLARNADKLATELRSLPRTRDEQAHDSIVADLSEPTNVEAALLARVSSARHGWVAPTILVNNTGGPPSGPALDATPAQLLAAVNAQLISSHLLVRALLPSFTSAKFGRVINITSTSVKQPIPNLGISNIVRPAVAAWAKCLATELGHLGVTVNNVLPGYTSTDRLDSVVKSRAAATSRSAEAIRAELVGATPTGRFATPEEIANAVTFLASPAAAYINGINLPVDGGRLASL